MDSPSEREERHEGIANGLYQAIWEASQEGFELVVRDDWKLDLRDQQTGGLEPIIRVEVIQDGQS